MIICRKFKNFSQWSDPVIFDAEGYWRNVVYSNNFAVGFKAKYINNYINGISLQMASVPIVSAFKLKYQLPTNINLVQTVIEEVTFTNK